MGLRDTGPRWVHGEHRQQSLSLLHLMAHLQGSAVSHAGELPEDSALSASLSFREVQPFRAHTGVRAHSSQFSAPLASVFMGPSSPSGLLKCLFMAQLYLSVSMN